MILSNSSIAKVDETGLHFEAVLNGTSYAKDVFENVQNGLVDSMSFGFTMGLDSFDKKEGGEIIFVARRNQVTTQWEKFDSYSSGLAVIVRNDYQKIDEEAVRYVEFTPATGE